MLAESPAGFELWNVPQKGLVCEGYLTKVILRDSTWNDSNTIATIHNQ